MGMTSAGDDVMSAAAFLVWSERQDADRRYELFDGRAFAMGAERAIHARTKNAVLRRLERAIADAGLDCEAFADGMAVAVDAGNVFEPDALVRCGPRLHDDVVLVTDPVIVVEVASPQTARVDALLKLTRYFRNAAIAHYLIALPEERIVLHHRRGDGGRIETAICGAGRLRLDTTGLEFAAGDLFPPLATPSA